MQIYCPKCKTGYEIKAELIPEHGRKLRCAQCKEIFVCRPEDLSEDSDLRRPEHSENIASATETQEALTPEKQSEETQAPEAAAVSEPENLPEENESAGEEKARDREDIDEAEKGIKDIFQRLSVETEALFKEEAAEKPARRLWGKVKKALGLHRPQNRKYYYLLLLVLGVLFMYYARYGIVRNIPCLLPVYEKLGINARILGEGLEFQNVNRRDFEEEFINKTEVKGFIANNTEQTIQIPRIRVELLDKNAQSLQVLVKLPSIDVIPAGGKVPFSFTLNKPSLFTKYIYLTFTDSQPSE